MRRLPAVVLFMLLSLCVTATARAEDDPKRMFEAATAEFNLGNYVTQPFATPSPAAMPPGQAWRTVPIANCTKVIGTCEPGGCANEDICVWAKM